MNAIPFYVESENGHDTENVRQGRLQGAVEEHLKKDEWVSLENKDGSTELLTKSDLPNEKGDKPSSDDWKDVLKSAKKGDTPVKSATGRATSKASEWADKFTKTTSATATKKAVGG